MARPNGKRLSIRQAGWNFTAEHRIISVRFSVLEESSRTGLVELLDAQSGDRPRDRRVARVVRELGSDDPGSERP